MYTWKKLFFCGLFPYETNVLPIALLENKIQWDEKKQKHRNYNQDSNKNSVN